MTYDFLAFCRHIHITKINILEEYHTIWHHHHHHHSFTCQRH